MHTIKYPRCEKKVELIPCNSRTLPDEYEERDEGRIFRLRKTDQVKGVQYG